MYQAGDVARVSGLTSPHLQKLLREGVFPTADEFGDRPGGGPGRVRLFSFESVAMIATAAELMRLGVPAQPAADAAVRFAHLGASAGETVTRLPGKLFPEGETVLLVWRDGDGFTSDVVSVADTDRPSRLFRSIETTPGHHPEAFAVVRLNRLMERLAGDLGVPLSQLG